MANEQQIRDRASLVLGIETSCDETAAAVVLREPDGTGRILISPELRKVAALDKEVMLLGMGNHLEIWDAVTLAAKEQAAIEAGMPDAIANFNF